MIDYLRQVAICEPVRERIKQAVVRSGDMSVRARTTHISTIESILRAVSVIPGIDTEEKLKDFAIEHILSSLRLTPIQKEHLNLNGEDILPPG